jgi:hypothetical protein
MATIENVRGEDRAPGDELFGSLEAPKQAEVPLHPLDTPDALAIHAKVLDYLYQAVDAHFDNRIQQWLDADFYDHIQWSDEDQAVVEARHQAPLTYNKIKIALDWVIGTERRTRIDGVVHPREQGDVEIAQIKTQLLKYLSDANRIPWARSLAFKDAAIVGCGWTEESIRADQAGEPVQVVHVPWPQMRADPISKSIDLSDCRYLTREKFLDLDYAEAAFPDRKELLGRSAHDHFDGDFGRFDEELDMPQVFRRYNSEGREVVGRRISGRFSMESRTRLRVRVIECWFRRPVSHKRIWGGNFSGEIFDPNIPEHAAAEDSMRSGVQPGFTLTNAVVEEMWCAKFTEDGLLELSKSPFRHGKFPYTPYYAYRRQRDGMAYGLVRGVRDSQEDLNKRMSKLLWAASANQLLYEEGAIDEDRLEEVKENLARPNGVIPLQRDGLKKIRIDRNLEVADINIRILELDSAHIHDGSGVNREQLGRDTNATSGRAILAKQNEGAVTTAELFDNYRLGVQLSGEKQLSLTEQYMTAERQFRIVGEREGIEWITINQMRLDELRNEWVIDNDIGLSHADFIVDQQDFRETMRMAYAEQFLELLAKLPPELSMQLMDLAVDMTDMPGKDEIVRRIREINGQAAAEVPEDPAELQAQQEQEAVEREMALRERLAKVGLEEAKRDEIIAKTKSLGLGSKGKALELAQLLDVLLPLAPAADRLMSDQPEPEEPQYA